MIRIPVRIALIIVSLVVSTAVAAKCDTYSCELKGRVVRMMDSPVFFHCVLVFDLDLTSRSLCCSANQTPTRSTVCMVVNAKRTKAPPNCVATSIAVRTQAAR